MERQPTEVFGGLANSMMFDSFALMLFSHGKEHA